MPLIEAIRRVVEAPLYIQGLCALTEACGAALPTTLNPKPFSNSRPWLADAGTGAQPYDLHIDHTAVMMVL